MKVFEDVIVRVGSRLLCYVGGKGLAGGKTFLRLQRQKKKVNPRCQQSTMPVGDWQKTRLAPKIWDGPTLLLEIGPLLLLSSKQGKHEFHVGARPIKLDISTCQHRE
ncbi:hypothetical protein BDBG_17662 [Blastomyces gilchristii SLH14081]|uniref:Uncharacterized protein n=1 Tax=Blastomyces gilchristii (strain SLH14081) TaxID=559298 RepID=A0A179UYZ8_BLAGS|nr:uncharacterized protein BDBG_17662 [Blastomyces gilchristii SLH14081]OAT12358.1 hypothetical protein BDBG_17662 [Blastomyces gilchristii SLH14081]